MLNKVIESLPQFAPSKQFFRTITAIFFIVFLLAQYPWAERLLGRIMNFPDLRHQVNISISENSKKILSQEEISLELLKLEYGYYRVLSPFSCFKIIKTNPLVAEMNCALQISDEKHSVDTATLTVINLGFGIAENVLIHISAPNSRIVKYRVDSQELYQPKTIKLEDGIIDIWLDRLSSGAGVNIELKGTNFFSEGISLKATSDQGSSLSIDSPSFSGQVDIYATNVVGLYSEVWQIIWESPPIREFRKSIYLDRRFDTPLQIISSRPFH